MRTPVPNSGGRPLATPLREFNTCHSPKDGKFCSRRGAGFSSSHGLHITSSPHSLKRPPPPKPKDGRTFVGVTSARPGKTNREVFGQMREFQQELAKLPGVTEARVVPGLGQWDGGWEPTWVVSYKGNGAARRLLARTGKRYDQDAVLLLKPCHGHNCDPVADIRFDQPLTRSAMLALGPALTAAGFGGWTWGRVRGKTTLRLASVPAWGGKAETHLKAVRQLTARLKAMGLTSHTLIRSVRAEAISRDQYDDVIHRRDRVRKVHAA